MMFSNSSDVLKTALRAASVVMLRVWRREKAAGAVSQIALRFCLFLKFARLQVEGLNGRC
jgi:hypothetical protein